MLVLCSAGMPLFAQTSVTATGDTAATLSADLQGLDAATLAQIISAQNQGTAPAVGKTEPEIKNLTVGNQSAVSGVTAATGAPAGISPLERMFSSMALALGGSTTDQTQFGYSLFDKTHSPIPRLHRR